MSGDEIVTARVVNNRTFTQRLQTTDGAQEWAWTWAGKENFGPSAVPVGAARGALDSGTTLLVPPLHEVAVGIGRPAGLGQLTITAAAKADVVTVLVDITSHVFDGIPIGGLENPLANAFLQAFYECGGKQLLSRAFDAGSEAMARAVVEAVTGCANEIVRPDSELGARFEALEQAVGAWRPACEDVNVDSNRLYQRLQQLGICVAVCTITGRVFFDHPSWGSSALLTTLSPAVDFRDGNIVVVDAAGKVRWRHWAGDWYELAPDCAAGTISHTLFGWNGTGYVQRPASS